MVQTEKSVRLSQTKFKKRRKVMKNSILKKIVSILATTAIIATSTTLVLADNKYASQTHDCSTAAKWTNVNGGMANTGCEQTITDGMLRSERSVMRGGNKTFVDATLATNTTVNFTADGNGGWVETTAGCNVQESLLNLDDKTISKGIAQAKFKFKFMGGAGQRINFMFYGYAGQTGIQIAKTQAYPIWPDGSYGAGAAYRVNYTTLTDGEWYILTAKLNLDKKTLSYTVEDEAKTWSVSNSTAIPNDKWGSYTTTGPLTSLAFRSGRDQDTTETIAEGGSSKNPTSVWYVDDIEFDRYTETNYSASNVYKSADGLVSSEPVEGFEYKGVDFKRLTRIADPLNASFITAAYDADGRMESVKATPLSAIADGIYNSDIAGNTVKSFVFDMGTANPYMPTSEKTIRSIDFNDGCTVITTNNKNAIPTQGYYFNNRITDMNVGSEDGALRFERTAFRFSKKYKNSNPGYHYDENGNRVLHLKADGITGDDDTSGHTGQNYGINLGKEVSSIKASLKFKFAGITDTSGHQLITVSLGKEAYNPNEYLLCIRRYADGSGRIFNDYGGTGTDFAAGQLKANEWYTLEFTYDYNGSYEAAKMSAKVTGDFNTGITETRTVINNITPRENSKVGQPINFFGIFSHRERDRAATSEVNTGVKTSVWYIDDIVLEY